MSRMIQIIPLNFHSWMLSSWRASNLALSVARRPSLLVEGQHSPPVPALFKDHEQPQSSDVDATNDHRSVQGRPPCLVVRVPESDLSRQQLNVALHVTQHPP